MIPIPLADIPTTLDHISQVWRSETAAEQRTDLADLDDLLGRLEAQNHRHRPRPSGSTSYSGGSRS